MKKAFFNRKQKTVYRRLLTLLAMAVVFITTYSLILPAITLEDDAATEDSGIYLSAEMAADDRMIGEAVTSGSFEGELVEADFDDAGLAGGLFPEEGDVEASEVAVESDFVSEDTGEGDFMPEESGDEEFAPGESGDEEFTPEETGDGEFVPEEFEDDKFSSGESGEGESTSGESGEGDFLPEEPGAEESVSEEPEEEAVAVEFVEAAVGNAAAPAAADFDLAVPDAEYNLHISYGVEAGIPAGARFVLTHPDEPEFGLRALELVDRTFTEDAVRQLRLLDLFDLSIYADGKVIEPTGPVAVSLVFDDGLDENEQLYIVHFPGTGAQAADEDNVEIPDADGADAVPDADAEISGSDEETAVPAANGGISGSARKSKKRSTSVEVSEASEYSEGSEPSDDSKPATSASYENSPELIPAIMNGATATFTVGGFSYYAIVGTTIEKNVLASDGKSYKVTVSYSPDSGIPEGAELEVKEVLPGENGVAGTFSVYGKSYEEYVANTENALGWEAGSASYARVFDISIVKDGKKVQPTEGKTVDVKIELADANGERKLNVVHFADEENAGDVVESSTDEQAVSFEAHSFSAYAIVQGPDAVPVGWHKISSIEELIAKGSSGVYIGHPDGYYYGNTTTGDSSRMGITKTKPAQSYPAAGAAKYYFEQVEGSDNQVYAYCLASDGSTKQYVYNEGNNSLNLTTDESWKTAFTLTQNSNGTFKLNNGAWYWNMQGGASGARFCSYNSANDGNNNVNLWYYIEVDSDPYELDGLSCGLMNWAGGAAGKALMAASSAENALDAKALTVMSTTDNSSQLFAPSDSDISMWTFHWITDDKYHISTVADGSRKYLKIDSNGLRLVSSESEASDIQVIPGTGTHAGEICLKSGTNTLTFSGTVADGFSVNGTVGSEWLNLVELSELTTDYFLTYSARKVSVSDSSVSNGSRVIVYTRSWNEEKLKYDYYAISSDGSLVPVYESGDSIEWVSGQINTLLWNFVEYDWEGTTDPNYYYELFNQYSECFIAPQITGNQILSDDTIGINLNGRRDGQYYSTILAWDEGNYSYVGLKVENGKIVTCPKSEAMDFYFAVMQDMNVDDTLRTVQTVDHTQYGITMKIIDFDTREEMSGFLGSDEGGATLSLQQGLLSTNLTDGYPAAAGGSLGTLFSGSQNVNHLFIQSSYEETGYFAYDSSQNFASLKGKTKGDFTVYKELGTYDSGGNKPTLKHGQFFPFNDLKAGTFASTNGKNLYSSTGAQLSDGDPRKNEQLYSVEYDNVKANTYFGVELEASFTQTLSGLDAWGHDIIFEFTGDDDFWLYVDGELVIDLGGIHSAVPGSVNFRTGAVNVNGSPTTLRAVFEENYRTRNPSATDEEAAEYLLQYFEEGSTVFRDDTTHTMKMFYLERGAGASNLKMRFNLAAVRKGTVQLTKELDGVDESDVLAQFPYQIWYKKEGETEYRLTNADVNSTQKDNYVLYNGSVNPVKYQPSVTIDGTEYMDVFFLKPGETADISFPEGMTSYRIVECGVDTYVYNKVTVNSQELAGTAAAGSSSRRDYGIDYATIDGRPKVKYENKVDSDALRTLTIKKELYEADGQTPIHYAENDTEFVFRLYLASEYDALDAANMQTYHVKDPAGNYCQWNAATQKLEKIGEGITDFTQLTPEQKVSASFTTSIYGTIARVPVDYTIEFRDVLAGTKFRVQERPSEIPDGYSFQQYVYNSAPSSNSAVDGITDAVKAGQDSDVIVRNLKGWGLRVNKVWRDKDYMSSRDAAYFALYTKDGGNNLTLVPDSVRQLSYDANPQTLYWYYDSLPVTGTTGLGDYVIREVVLGTGAEGTIEVGKDGAVTGYSSVSPVGQNDQIILDGTQKGETTSSPFTYQVQYTEGTIVSYTNVRVDTVTNDRPGLILKKQDWDGNALAGATFILETEGTTVGTFISDVNGLITTAFLSNGKEYVLTEKTSPQGYHGLETVLRIRVTDGVVSVSGPNEAYYSLTQAEGTTLATLTVKNRPFTFRAVKKDGDTGAAMANVTFALHRQVTVDGVTAIDLNPMPGYESLETDESGVISQIDNTLPAGTYELREKETLDGYEMLSGYIRFTISPTGAITLGTHPQDVTLPGTPNHEGVLEYVLTIPNYKRGEFTFTKAWRAAVGNTKISWPDNKSITVNILQAKGESDTAPGLYATYSITQSDVGTLNTEIGATNDGTLPKLKVTGNSGGAYTFQLEGLPATGSENGNTVNYVYYVSEPGAVAGFQNAKYFSGEEQAMGASRIGAGGIICNDQIGYVLPSTGGRGNRLRCLLGTLLLALAVAGLALRKRRRA